MNNAPGQQSDFPGNQFSSGEIVTKNPKLAIGDAAWIICAVSLRGQKRYKFKVNYNGYCWDGVTTKADAEGHFYRLVYWRCKVDFVGATFVNKKKRTEPVGYFHDEPVYGVERVDDDRTIEVKVPRGEVPLQDSRTSFIVT